jgi:predicted RNase H-like HicB family nuclease
MSPQIAMKLTALFEPAAEGGYVCWLEEMPSAQTQGETMVEARSNLLDAFLLSLAYQRERSRAFVSAGGDVSEMTADLPSP